MILTWLTEGWESILGRVKYIHFYISSRPSQPDIQCVEGILSQVVKGQEREANQSPPSGVEAMIHESTHPLP
jgi:hypothetical protein